MQLRAVLIVLIIGAVYLHQTEAAPKLGLIKAKIALAKAPHIIAKVAVAKEVKAKTKLALATSWAAVKATKLAALSAITAPFRVAKKTIALKIAGLKAAKAVKAAKIVKAANILNNLKKSPIILPIPVAVPVNSLHSLKSFKSAPIPNLFNISPPSLATSLGPIKQIVSGAQKAFQTASYKIPALSALTHTVNAATETVPAVTLASVHRFVPSVVDLTDSSHAHNEVPATPTNAYGLPPAVPAHSYGQLPAVPAHSYGQSPN